MRKFWSILMLAIVLFTLVIARPSFADASPEDIAQGAKIFSANCTACHMKGENLVAANKTLKAEALHQFGMDSPDAIITQVLNGKNAMPSFKSRLTQEQIEAVAAYVLDQSEKGWKA